MGMSFAANWLGTLRVTENTIHTLKCLCSFSGVCPHIPTSERKKLSIIPENQQNAPINVFHQKKDGEGYPGD